MDEVVEYFLHLIGQLLLAVVVLFIVLFFLYIASRVITLGVKHALAWNETRRPTPNPGE